MVSYMQNIKFDSVLTKEKVKALDKVVNEIESILNDINYKYLELDNKYWVSKNKEKLDAILINYLKKIRIDYPNNLRTYNNLLNLYANDYSETFNYINSLIK